MMDDVSADVSQGDSENIAGSLPYLRPPAPDWPRPLKQTLRDEFIPYVALTSEKWDFKKSENLQIFRKDLTRALILLVK